MNLKRRIESLEKKSPPAAMKLILIRPLVGASLDKTRERYCEENGLDLVKLENGDYGLVKQIKLVKPEAR